MPASGIIASVSALDSIAANATCTINGKDLGPHSRVAFIRLSAGHAPSYALVHVPLAVLDDIAPSIAGVNTSPVYGVRHWNPAIVTGQLNPNSIGDPTLTLLTGVVTSIDPDINRDEAIITIEDWRFMLDGIMVMGSFWLDWSNNVVYREGVKPHFNIGNAPNAIFFSVNLAGGETMDVPLFCTPYYGIDNSITTVNSAGQVIATKTVIPDPSTTPTKQATWWTHRMKLDYLLFAHNASNGYVDDDKFPFYHYIPDSIIVPSGIGNILSDVNQTTGERKATECVWHCHSLMAAITDCCHEGGNYEPYMQSNDDGTGTLSIVQLHYQGADGNQNQTPSTSSSKGAVLSRATSGKAQDVLTQGGNINQGRLRESSKSTFSITASVGAHPFIEQRFQSSVSTAHGGNLYWKYTQSDFNAAKMVFLNALNDKATDLSTTSISNALEQMFQQYQNMFCEYIVQPDYDFQTGTGQEGFPLAQIGRPPLPHILTSYIQGGNADLFGLLNSQRPIPVEYSFDESNPYNLFNRPDGMEILSDGTISLRHLRDSFLNNNLTPLNTSLWNITVTGTPGNFVIPTFQPTSIRLTIALPCDHRITQAARISSDPTPNVVTAVSGGTVAQFNAAADDSDRIDPTMSRFMAVDTGALHAYEERNALQKSYPIPQSLKQLGGLYTGQNYPAADGMSKNSIELFGSAVVLRDDTKACFDHAVRGLKRVGRLDRGGTLGTSHIILTTIPGMFVDSLNNNPSGPFPVKACVSMVDLNFEKPQKTEYTLV